MSNDPSLPADGLGAMLRQARERAGLELSEIAERTHVRKAYLEALEAEDLAELPEDVYARNFVRLFARAVALDPEPALDAFSAMRRAQRTRSSGVFRTERATGEHDGAARPATPRPSDRGGASRPASPPRRTGLRPALRGIVPTLVMIVLAGALIGTAVWGFNRLLFRTDQGGISARAGDPTAAADVEANGADATSADDAASGLAAPVLPGGDALPDEVFLSVVTEPAGAEVSVDAFPLPGTTPIELVPVTARERRTLVVTRDGYLPYEASVDLSRDRELRIVLDPLPTPEGAAAGPADADGVVVEVREATWLEAYQSTTRGDGQRLVYTTAQPGERYTFERPVYLHLGNAAGVDVFVDGEAIGALGSSGAVTGRAFPAP